MYLIIILFLILVNIYFKKNKCKINLYPLIILLLILYSGLRYKYGYDYENYLIHFEEINSISDVINTNYEKGYSLLVYLFKIVGLGFNSILLFISFLSIKLKEKVFNELSLVPEISLLLYFLLFYVINDIEQIRHGISIGFCFYSLVYLNRDTKNSRIISLGLMMLGILFHTSAIFFVPIYFVRNRFFNKKTYGIILSIAIILSLINYFDLINLLNDFILHSNYISQKVNLYLVERQSLLQPTLLIKLFILLVFYYYAFDASNKLHRLFFNVYYIGIIYTILFSSIPILVARVSTYMRYAEIILIPIYFQNIKNLGNKKLHYFISSCIIIYFLFRFISVILNPVYFNYSSI